MSSILRRPFMPSRILARVLVLLLLSLAAQAQRPELSKTVQELVRVRAPKVILTHVRIVDGTGTPAVEDQNVVIEDGKITAVQNGADVGSEEHTSELQSLRHLV